MDNAVWRSIVDVAQVGAAVLAGAALCVNLRDRSIREAPSLVFTNGTFGYGVDRDAPVELGTSLLSNFGQGPALDVELKLGVVHFQFQTRAEFIVYFRPMPDGGPHTLAKSKTNPIFALEPPVPFAILTGLSANASVPASVALSSAIDSVIDAIMNKHAEFVYGTSEGNSLSKGTILIPITVAYVDRARRRGCSPESFVALHGQFRRTDDTDDEGEPLATNYFRGELYSSGPVLERLVDHFVPEAT
ncbi:MAG: hypothetical protein KF875_03830 [Trueperaceae bacterium]|nr:hypothetical protein [Trueperaceae bacterium]